MDWLAEYEAKLKGATPGPWAYDEHADAVYSANGMINELNIGVSNGQFIAASPEMVAKLIAAVKCAEDALDDILYCDQITTLNAAMVVAMIASEKLKSGEFPREGE